MTTWWAQVTTDTDRTGLDNEHLAAVVERLPGYGMITASAQALRLEMTIDADTLDAAADAAMTAVFDALADTGTPGALVGVRVITAQDRDREVAHPEPVTLVGSADIADMLGVTRQRAHQITERGDFPDPIGHIRTGPVYTRASVDAFEATWARQSGRPAK